MASSPPHGRSTEEEFLTEGEGSPLLPNLPAHMMMTRRDSDDLASRGEDGLLGVGGGGGHGNGGGSGRDSGTERLTVTTTATEGSERREASVMRSLWANSGYHSDSAIPTSAPMHESRRRVAGSREMLDPAAEPLMGTDGEREESDGEHLARGAYGHMHGHHLLEHGGASYDGDRGVAVRGLPASLADFDFRSPMSDVDWVQPRKARWNRKVTRKRSKRPSTAVRKGRLAVYCIASELQTEKLQRYLLQRKKERVPILTQTQSGPPHQSTPQPPASPYYGTNGPAGGMSGGGGGGANAYYPPPQPPSLTTTSSTSLLLPTAAVATNNNNGLYSSGVGIGGPVAAAGGGSSSTKPPGLAMVDQCADLVGLNWRDKNYMGVVYTTNDDGKCDPLDVKHIFCFPYGCTVFWGCTKEEEERFIALISQFAVEPVSDAEREESYDDFAYSWGSQAMILHYEVTLTSNDPEEKLALSFALAQSAKLFVFEDRVDGTITSTKHIPIHLAEFGKINVSRKEISKLTGKVFLERNEVNLHSDILDTPEWFWEADLWEPRYVAFCKYLDLPNRINILNKRLDILRELLNVLETQLDNSHSTKLELIVIALIIVEVVLQVLEIALNDLLHVDRLNY